jgi:outer membrane protein assembly factor BamA
MKASPTLRLARVLLPFLLFSLGFPQTAAHKPPPSDTARTLIAVKVTGTKRYAQEDVVAASGLQMGSIVSDEDFKKASRHLADTGAFRDIAYTFSYSSAGTKLEFQLADADKFLPARFEDFVWFTDDELLKKIKEHVPLFNGELPISGRLPDEVSDVLQAFLVQNGVPGHVNYLRATGTDGRLEAFNYSASDVLIRVRKVEFVGAAASELPLLESAAERLPDREYARSRMNVFVEHQLLPIYHTRGYLKASFGPPQPTVVKPEAGEASDDRNQTFVDVRLAVSPGQQYKLTKVEWSGNREFSTDKLQAMIHLQPGQPANTVRLADDLASVRDIYAAKGYLRASINPEAQLDDASSTVTFHLEVKEDYVYHMGELEFRGLDNSLTAKLRSAWKLRPGDVYDATYLSQYLPQAKKLLPAAVDWVVVSHVTANMKDKTVDVDLQYSAKAPR